MRRAATLLAPRLLGGAKTTSSAVVSSSSAVSSTGINAAAALATAARSFAADAASLLKTPLYDLHVEAGGEKRTMRSREESDRGRAKPRLLRKSMRIGRRTERVLSVSLPPSSASFLLFLSMPGERKRSRARGRAERAKMHKPR